MQTPKAFSTSHMRFLSPCLRSMPQCFCLHETCSKHTPAFFLRSLPSYHPYADSCTLLGVAPGESFVDASVALHVSAPVSCTFKNGTKLLRRFAQAICTAAAVDSEPVLLQVGPACTQFAILHQRWHISLLQHRNHSTSIVH